MKRFNQMSNPYVVAAWILSPVPEIQQHVRDNLKPKYKTVVVELLVKLMVDHQLEEGDARDEKIAEVTNDFWEEWNAFNTRTGDVFDGKKYIWKSKDITTNKSWQWHKINSLCETKVLGKFACRVVSKIIGIGNAERCWGDVKHLKDGKRSHMSSKSISMQATIYGSACAEKAAARSKGEKA